MVKTGTDPGKILIPSQIQSCGKPRQGLNKLFYQTQQSDAWDALRHIQDDAVALRQSFLEDSINTENSKKGRNELNKILKAILWSEYLAKMWPKLRRYAKVRSSLGRVEIPIRDKQGEIIGWYSVSTHDELFSELLKQNKAHFAQAKDTPPICQWCFRNKIQPFGQNGFAEEILDGSVDLEWFEVSDAIKACIHEMRYASKEDGSNPVTSTITADKICSSFKRISERLTSSPSGRH